MTSYFWSFSQIVRKRVIKNTKILFVIIWWGSDMYDGLCLSFEDSSVIPHLKMLYQLLWGKGLPLVFGTSHSSCGRPMHVGLCFHVNVSKAHVIYTLIHSLLCFRNDAFCVLSIFSSLRKYPCAFTPTTASCYNDATTVKSFAFLSYFGSHTFRPNVRSIVSMLCRMSFLPASEKDIQVKCEIITEYFSNYIF